MRSTVVVRLTKRSTPQGKQSMSASSPSSWSCCLAYSWKERVATRVHL
jgi:hypothetical protein